MKRHDVIDQVKEQKDLTNAMLNSKNPGSGIPFDAEITTSDRPEPGRKRNVNEGELRKKLERGYI